MRETDALTPEQEELRRRVRRWVDEVVVPPAIENDRLERFPAQALEGLRELGLLGLNCPRSERLPRAASPWAGECVAEINDYMIAGGI